MEDAITINILPQQLSDVTHDTLAHCSEDNNDDTKSAKNATMPLSTKVANLSCPDARQIAATQNQAHVNLDVKNNRSTNAQSVFAIYDGHNGKQASTFLKKHFAERVAALPPNFTNTQLQDLILEMDAEYKNM